ncbi:unnamed protein product [Pseudo-nitzschia multistriata]|uniref:Uncharacterized protein n=1 Tax=Pseudo-nitzschia multistriata TaxID=183589 RepID=A0A448YZM9_9STRA|nr:unnamed protein product [Pseudo-nitzschia multistriata]
MKSTGATAFVQRSNIGSTKIAIELSIYNNLQRMQPRAILSGTTRTKITSLRMASKPKGRKKKSKKKKSNGGGKGFGGGGAASAAQQGSDAFVAKPIKADKNALETQWDTFASITDLEIKCKCDPDSDDCEFFEVVDVHVRYGSDGTGDATTGWFRIGKVCTSANTSITAALALQKGLILWTAVHMRRELLAKGGKAGARSLELGWTSPAIIYMGTETDGPLEQDEVETHLNVLAGKPSPSLLSEVKPGSFGFRPDWNPEGFTYKRREKAALKDKKKKSGLEELLIDE